MAVTPKLRSWRNPSVLRKTLNARARTLNAALFAAFRD
jgi:hypothetical protein